MSEVETIAMIVVLVLLANAGCIASWDRAQGALRDLGAAWVRALGAARHSSSH